MPILKVLAKAYGAASVIQFTDTPKPPTLLPVFCKQFSGG